MLLQDPSDPIVVPCLQTRGAAVFPCFVSVYSSRYIYIYICRTPHICLHNFMVFCYMEPPKVPKILRNDIWTSFGPGVSGVPGIGSLGPADVRRTSSTWRIQVATCHAKEVISSWRALRSGMPRWPHVFHSFSKDHFFYGDLAWPTVEV